MGRLGSEPTGITVNAKRARRIDQVWVSPEMQARLLDVEQSWAPGIKIHAWPQSDFRAGPPDQSSSGSSAMPDQLKEKKASRTKSSGSSSGGSAARGSPRGDVDCV